MYDSLLDSTYILNVYLLLKLTWKDMLWVFTTINRTPNMISEVKRMYKLKFWHLLLLYSATI